MTVNDFCFATVDGKPCIASCSNDKTVKVYGFEENKLSSEPVKTFNYTAEDAAEYSNDVDKNIVAVSNWA